MGGALFLVISTVFGWSIKELLEIRTENLLKISSRKKMFLPSGLFDYPFYLIVGTTLLTTVNFFLAYFFSVFSIGETYPLLPANIISFAIAFIFIFFALRKKINSPGKVFSPGLSEPLPKYAFFILSVSVFALFSIFLIFYTFYVKDGILHSGYTVFSDFAPHTAVIHSFSKGNNFPPEYPHFAGDGIRYHFFFFYLCANLQYLGMRIDYAMNIPSILGLMSFSSLLGVLGIILTGKKAVFLIAPMMLHFRSSYAIFDYLKEIVKEEGFAPCTIISTLISTDKFIGTTPFDEWGLWAMNVYANQRHLLWGFSAILIVIILFLPTIKNEFKLSRWTEYLTRKDLWSFKNPKVAFLTALLIGILPYWHGSMIITVLCILPVMFFFSADRLSYIATGVSGIAGSFIWSGIFSRGAQNIVNPEFHWGFISPDKSGAGVAQYLFRVIGVSLLIILFLLFTEKQRKRRIMMVSFLIPTVFALTVSLTPDVTVNHKYIIASVALMNIFIAEFFVNVWKYIHKKAKGLKNLKDKKGLQEFVKVAVSFICGIVLTFSLFATGFVELAGYVNGNKGAFRIDLNSGLTRWVEENTRKDAIFLTAPYHMNEFFFSGRKIFFGWPYYTWSAGHDTHYRENILRNLLHGYNNDPAKFKETVKEYNIRYAIIDSTLIHSSDYITDIGFFEDNFKKVYDIEGNEQTGIYKLYD